MQNLILTTIQREEFVFQSIDAEDLANLVNFLIDGLKEKSQYVIATQDYDSTSEYNSLSTINYHQEITNLLHEYPP